ncbi:MAG: 5-bromo-4-chloroindolyl phosphate hydrolysis family protein [Oscillospiraceae bacterium]|jgi:5-bromo-4-chloroindolyl phosphate hydrolysis protein|nr:5-bromo-4-chloroindolyl phosphate hydrolysis family protein [Oscillospiraceae bacterium]
MGNTDYSKIGKEISRAVREAMRAANLNNIEHTVEDSVRGFTDDINEVFGGPGSAGHRPPHPYAPSDNQQESWQEDQTPPQGQQAQSQKTPPAGWQTPPQPIRPQPAPYPSQHTSRHRMPGNISGTICFALGLVIGVPLLITDIASVAVTASSTAISSYWYGGMAVLCSITAAAAVLTWYGAHLRRRARRFQRYQDALDGAAFSMVDQLADTAGQTRERTLKDLKKMISTGVYSQGHLDRAQTCFMVDDETYEAYLEAEKSYDAREAAAREKKEKAEADPRQAQLEEVRREGSQYLDEIRKANEAIPGKEISEKLSKLEDVTSRIFACVQLHPEKLPEIKRFMRYYLPTTLKLVKAYQEFDNQPAQGQNITKAKAEIEDSLDTVNDAFANLLDSLFANDALDISADISTLETMLHQEGLTGSDFSTKEKREEKPVEKLTL